MQKRRPHNNNSASLPLTNQDVTGTGKRTKSSSSRKRTRSHKQGSGGASRIVAYSILLGLIIGGLYLGIHILTGPSGATRRMEQEDLELPLSQYTSLEFALKNSKLVGLYFAAAWCPMSTPVTNMIDEFLGEQLLPPPSPDVPLPVDRAPISLVYVSSDKSEEAFLSYHKRNWFSVPFDSDERTALKKQFSTCAKPEVQLLGIDRKFEIPTLLILDGETHGILTTNGAEDLEEYHDKAVEHWMGLHNLVRAMAEKYADEGHGLIKSQDRRIHHAESFSSLFA